MLTGAVGSGQPARGPRSGGERRGYVQEGVEDLTGLLGSLDPADPGGLMETLTEMT